MASFDMAMLTLGNYPKLTSLEVSGLSYDGLDGVVGLHLVTASFGNWKIFEDKQIKKAIIDSKTPFKNIVKMRLSLPFTP